MLTYLAIAHIHSPPHKFSGKVEIVLNTNSFPSMQNRSLFSAFSIVQLFRESHLRRMCFFLLILCRQLTNICKDWLTNLNRSMKGTTTTHLQLLLSLLPGHPHSAYFLSAGGHHPQIMYIGDDSGGSGSPDESDTGVNHWLNGTKARFRRSEG